MGFVARSDLWLGTQPGKNCQLCSLVGRGHWFSFVCRYSCWLGSLLARAWCHNQDLCALPSFFVLADPKLSNPKDIPSVLQEVRHNCSPHPTGNFPKMPFWCAKTNLMKYKRQNHSQVTQRLLKESCPSQPTAK